MTRAVEPVRRQVELPLAHCDSKVQDGMVESIPAGDSGGGVPSGNTRKRQTSGELRQHMLDAGRSIMQEEGLETTSGNLTFKRVFDRVAQDTGRQLTNASIIRRIWENQADYQADVLVEIAHDEQRPEIEATLSAVEEVLEAVDLSSPTGRLQGMSELCRLVSEASRLVIIESSSWQLWISVVAIATGSSNAEQQQRMCTALAEGYRSTTEFWENIYQGLLAILGLRPRAPLTISQFTTIVMALSEGSTLRQRVDGESESVELPSLSSDGVREWSLYGIAIEAVAVRFFEPDPAFIAP